MTAATATALKEFRSAGPITTFAHGAETPAETRLSAAFRRVAGGIGIAAMYLGDGLTMITGNSLTGIAVSGLAMTGGGAAGLFVAQDFLPMAHGLTQIAEIGGAGIVGGGLAAYAAARVVGPVLSKAGDILGQKMGAAETILARGNGWQSVRRSAPTSDIVYRVELDNDGRERSRRVHCEDGWAVVRKGALSTNVAMVNGERAFVVRGRGPDDTVVTSRLMSNVDAYAFSKAHGGKVRSPDEADFAAVRFARENGINEPCLPLKASVATPAPVALTI